MPFPSTPQAPVLNGIMPSGALGAQMTALTRRAFVPSVFVQIYQSHPLLSMLMQNAQKARGGASQITIPAQGASFTSFSWGSFAGDFPMPEDQAAIQNAQFNLKLGMVPIGFFGMEAITQSSEVVIPKLRAVMSDSAVVIKQAIAESLYTNNFANSNAIDSLVQAYDDGTAVTSYGGITRTGNNWWKGQVIANAAGITSNVGLATTLTRVAAGAGGESPDVIVMNPANWATLMSSFQNFEQFMTTPKSVYGKDSVVNSGFRAISILDTPVFADPFCPINEMYMLNTKYIAMYLSEYAPMTFSGFQSAIPQGQIADIGVLITALNLVCSKPSSGARITGLGSNAWNQLTTPAA